MCRWVICVAVLSSVLGTSSASYLRSVTPHITPDEIRWEIDLALYDRLSEVRLERKSGLVGGAWELVEVQHNSLPQLVLCDPNPSGAPAQFYRIRYAFADGAQWLDGVAPESGGSSGGGSGGETGEEEDCAEEEGGTLPEPTMPMLAITNEITVTLGDHSDSSSEAYQMDLKSDKSEVIVSSGLGELVTQALQLPGATVYTIRIAHTDSNNIRDIDNCWTNPWVSPCIDPGDNISGPDPDYTAYIEGEGIYLVDDSALMGVHETGGGSFAGEGKVAQLYLPGGYIEASDAHDPRRTSHTKLVMVRGQAERGANLTLHGGGYLPDFPQWRGQGVQRAEGASAQWSGSGNALIIAELGNGVEDKLFVELVDEKRFAGALHFDSQQMQKIQQTINSVLKKLGGSTAEVSGSLSAEFKRVDYYGDGSRWGVFIHLEGGVYAQLPDVVITSPPIPIPGTAATISFEGAFESSTISLMADTAFDQSKEHAGSVSGTLSGESTARIGTTASMGVRFVGEVSLTLEGSATLQAYGQLAYCDHQIKARGGVGADDFAVTITGEAEILGQAARPISLSYSFDYDSTSDFEAVLHDFN